jgi:hypothetical protein
MLRGRRSGGRARVLAGRRRVTELGMGRKRAGLVHGDARRPFIVSGRRCGFRKVLEGLGEEEGNEGQRQPRKRRFLQGERIEG